jgi:hypothetical protein
MAMKCRVLVAMVLFAGILHAADDLNPLAPLPVKWSPLVAAGFDATQCRSGVDVQLERDGLPNLSVRCHNTGYMGTRQDVAARNMWGKRVRFSAWIRTEGIDSMDAGGRAGAGLWVRCCAMTSRPVNETMDDRRVRGSTDWQYHEVVFDVEQNSQWINLGIWLRGKGQVWARDLKFEQIGNSIPNASSALIASSGITLVPPEGAPPTPLAPLPTGWTFMGGGGPLQLPGRCEIGVDSTMAGSNQPIHTVRCSNRNQPSFGGAYFTFDSPQYRGKRVRISGWLKAVGIETVVNPRYSSAPGEAGLWLTMGSGTDTRQDRMQDRTVKGTTDWVYRDFVADVPPGNNRMMVGFWMQGTGQVWVRDLKVEEVSATVPPNFFWNDPSRPAGPDLSLQ